MSQRDMHLNLYSRRVWIEERLQAASLQIRGDLIRGVVKGKKVKGAKDLGDLVIMPGVIDAHVHINEPGRTDWEGFDTATKAAAKGGTTTLVDMPLNSRPAVTDVGSFEKKLDAAAGKLHVNCGFWAGAVDARTKDTKALIESGCLGVKVFLSHSGIDEFPNISLSDLDEIMRAVQSYGLPVLAHCEIDTLPAEHALKDRPTSYREYVKSRPKNWENEAVKAFVGLGEKNECKIHIVHLSSADLLDWIARKKQMGLALTVETCPHYILFHSEAIEDGNALYKCAPPIRDKANNLLLIQALKEGSIDFISTDHSPAPPEIKELHSGNLAKAWGGIAGLQFLLSASWTALRADLNLEAFIPLVTSRPAQFLGLDSQIGRIQEAYRADLTIWDPAASFEVTENMVEHRHKATPYMGKTLYGKMHSTIVNGRIVFENGDFVNLSCGRIIRGRF